MTRQELIEQILRLVYGGQPTDDASITPNLVNIYINQGIASAVRQSYNASIQVDNVGYINNSFYTTYKNLSITNDEQFLWKATLPQMPMAIGINEGVASVRIKDNTNNLEGIDCIPLSIKQKAYARSMRTIPNSTLYYYENNTLFLISTIPLNPYTLTVTMISGGGSSSGGGSGVNSPLNVPEDYIPLIVEYVVKMLTTERKQIQDQANDGISM